MRTERDHGTPPPSTAVLRATGIPVLGPVPWGTHLSQFYGGRDDLLEILVPYFRAGLDAGERCLWVVSGTGAVERARAALRDAGFGGQGDGRAAHVEVVAHEDFYLDDDGAFCADRVIASLRARVHDALAEGYQGLRLHADEGWLTRETWDTFLAYEAAVDGVLRELPVLALCTYPLEGTSGADVLDVARRHKYTLARRNGAWEVLEAAESVGCRAAVERQNAALTQAVAARTRELADASAALGESEALYRFLTENTLDVVTLYDAEGRRVYISPSQHRVLGYTPQDALAGVHPDDLPAVHDGFARIRRGEPAHVGFRHRHADGTWHWMESVGTVVQYRGAPHVLATTRDVTERKRLEEDLQEREALYRLLSEHSNDVITLRDVSGALVYRSPSAERVLGGVPSHIAGAMDRLDPEDRTVAEASWGQVEEGSPVRTLLRYRHPAGHWLWLEGWAERVSYRGRPHVLQVHRDVTARREAELAHLWFLESLAQVNRAIQGTTDVTEMMRDVLDVVVRVFDADRARLIHPTDPAAERWVVVMARGPGAQAGTDEEVGSGARTPGVEAMVERLRAAAGPLQFGAGEGQQPWPDAPVAPGIRSALALLVQPQAGSPYLLEIVQAREARAWTAGEERLAEEVGRRLADGLTALTVLRDLRMSEARFRILVDHATDAFFLQDERGTILDANRQASASLGYTREELVGMEPEDFDLEATEARDRDLRARLAAGEVVALDTRFRRKDGSVFPVEVRARAFVEHGRAFVVALTRDVSERKRLEEEFRQAQKMEAVGRLAGGVAHDFNNLLTAILGYVDLALLDLPPGGSVAEDLGEIRAAAERARDVTRQLLAFSRRQGLETQVVDVGDVVRGMERLLRLLVREDVELRVRVREGPLRVSMDPTQLEQILLNLVVNASDATSAGGRITVDVDPLPDPRAHGLADVPGGCARLRVADDGAGMTPEVTARIFEPFFTTKPVGIGTGLGLSTVFAIVRQSAGHVSVETQPGQGTTFTVLLPLAAAEAEPRPARPGEPAAGVGGVSVVVVEDEASVRRFVAGALRRNGIQVQGFPSPAEALPVLEDAGRVVDVLLTDVVLPGMSGPDLAARARRTRPDLPVIFMSGYTADEEPFAEALRAAAVLPKPFGVETLVAAIAAVLRR